jgi:hypothetical protein
LGPLAVFRTRPRHGVWWLFRARSEPTTIMPKPRESSARTLERKRFEAAMRSEPVQKLIRENAPADRISGLVGASHDRVRSWLKARGQEK